MSPEIITSKANPKVRELRKLLRRKKYRQEGGRFLAEGAQAIAIARQHGWKPLTLVYSPERLHSPLARAIVLETPERFRLPLSPSVFETLSERDNPPELIGVFAVPPDDLDRIPVRESALLLLLDRIRDPGNLGAIIRSADALGAQGVVLYGDSVDPYHPQSVRATMGSLFAVPVVHLREYLPLKEWVERLRAACPQLQLVGADPHSGRPPEEMDGTQPTLLVIGNEQKGLSPELLQLCDLRVTIPMVGAAESLNTAVAASILLYEIARQRRVASQGSISGASAP
ncbi:MAG: rRNA methyltransferase [Candidatus Poribacteria bacterium]|nr:MAG: rRNA methyltransferase [Candidatus Poribacteria bacterium]